MSLPIFGPRIGAILVCLFVVGLPPFARGAEGALSAADEVVPIPASGGIVELRTTVQQLSVGALLPADLPANSFWIEAEDFDYHGGQSKPEASVMPYLGGAYSNVAQAERPINGVDLRRPAPGPLNTQGALAAYRYRTDIPGWIDEAAKRPDYYVPMGQTFLNEEGPVANTRPGGVVPPLNYRIGWNNASWYNYSRTVPDGTYTAYAAASFYDSSPPEPGQIDATFSMVTAGVGTSNQTLRTLGTFFGAARGMVDTLTPLKNEDGSQAVFNVRGRTTFRYFCVSGDSDYVVLVPVTNIPARIVEMTPADRSTPHRSSPVIVKMEDFSSAVVPETVTLTLDGVDVTADTRVTQTGGVTELQYTPSPIWAANSAHQYVVRFADNALPPRVTSVTNSFTVNPLGAPGTFLIEAEDFDFDGGKTKSEASEMPYFGGAYEGLGAVYEVDYRNSDALDAAEGGVNYRTGPGDLMQAGTHVDMDQDLVNTPEGRYRGSWDVAVSYKIGWVTAFDWQNYTRTFPSGVYSAYAALSFGSITNPPAPHQLAGNLGQVVSGAATTNQTVLSLGSFDAPGTGRWGLNSLVPLRDAAGSLSTISLDGEVTLRYNCVSGDVDYLVLIPGALALAPEIIASSGSQEVDVGAIAVLEVRAVGTSPLRYQWRLNGQPIPGAEQPTLALNGVALADAGHYDVVVSNDRGSVTSSPATLVITSANYPPTFVKGADLSVNEDAGAQSVANWATAISAGPTNESTQTLAFVVTNDNHALFATQPAIALDGALAFTPAANAAGTATVSVVLKDDGGTENGGQDTSAAQTFTIEVVRVDSPQIEGISWDQDQLQIRWEGGHLLQWAPDPTGPWTDLPEAGSPFTVVPDAGHRFYRLKALDGQ